MTKTDYSRMCFVAMPYGPRRVGRRTIDFDAIYQEIFRNAVKRVRLNGLSFVPRRADDSLNSRILVHEMLTALIQSRLMLADVSVDNTNVGAEIATRYAWVPSGTVLVRLRGTRIPFDFSQVQVTDYVHEPEELVPDAQARIAKALRETLKFGAIDNPFFEHAKKLTSAMGTPGNPTELGNLLVDAELAIRRRDLRTAIDKYRKAQRIHPELASLPRRRATLLVAGGFVDEAQKEMRKALKIQPDFPEADRWLEQIKHGKVPKPSYLDRAYFEPLILSEYQQVSRKRKKRKKLFELGLERMVTVNMDRSMVKDVKIKETDFTRGGGLRRGGRLGGRLGGGFSGR